MKTDQTNADFFTTRTFEMIREWPIHEQCDFLAGLLAIVGDNPIVEPLRIHLNFLISTDSNAELFASGRQRLNLNAE